MLVISIAEMRHILGSQSQPCDTKSWVGLCKITEPTCAMFVGVRARNLLVVSHYDAVPVLLTSIYPK